MNAPSGERDNCDFYHDAYFSIECLFVPILTPRIVRCGSIVPLSEGLFCFVLWFLSILLNCLCKVLMLCCISLVTVTACNVVPKVCHHRYCICLSCIAMFHIYAMFCHLFLFYVCAKCNEINTCIWLHS